MFATPPPRPVSRVAHEESLTIDVGGLPLEAELALPASARGLVLFAHGSGSSRWSSRNRFVAAVLRERGLGTLLFDLLTSAEERSDAVRGHLRFDIGLLADRLCAVTSWLGQHEPAQGLPFGCFGASTGAAAALMAAAKLPEQVRAVVSRGGRPDLAKAALTRVRAPTLLIVGGDDWTVLELNREALELLPCEKQLSIVEGATHLFEEPGALDEVAQLASDWFCKHLGSSPHSARHCQEDQDAPAA